MHRFYRTSPRELLRDAALALVIGAGIGVVLWIGDKDAEGWWIVPSAAWIGLWIHSVVTATLLLFSRVLARLTRWRLYSVMIVLMFSASAIAFYLGVQTLPLLNPLFELVVGERPPWLMIAWATPDWAPLLAFAGGLGVVVGLLFFRYELLKRSLQDSVDKLKEREHAERELETARKIQRRILGPGRLEGAGYRLAARNLPALYVAGDFYDVSPRSDGALGLVVADVSGKGMAASLVMASVKGRLPLVSESRGVADTLAQLNHSLVDELDRREFVALCHVRYSPASGEFELANAGLPDPYVLATGRPPRPVAVPGPRLPLGVKSDIAYESVSGRLEPGERLFLMTDGLPEASVPGGSPLGYPRLEQMLGEIAGSPEEWLDELFSRLEQAVGTSREDDWTALIIERSG